MRERRGGNHEIKFTPMSPGRYRKIPRRAKKKNGMSRRKPLGPPIGSGRWFDSRELASGAGVEARMDALEESRPVRRFLVD